MVNLSNTDQGQDKKQGMGLLVCETSLILSYGSSGAVCTSNQWYRSQIRAKVGVIDSTGYDAIFVRLDSLVWFFFIANFCQNTQKAQNTWTFNFDATCLNCEPPQPFTQFLLPSSFSTPTKVNILNN